MARSVFRCYHTIIGLSGAITISLISSIALAQSSLSFDAKFVRVNDDLRPRLGYIIEAKIASKSERSLDDASVSITKATVHFCDGTEDFIEHDNLIVVEERCEDPIGGPLTFKSVELGDSLDVLDEDNTRIGMATWTGEEFRIETNVDWELSSSAGDVETFQAGENYSISPFNNAADYVVTEEAEHPAIRLKGGSARIEY